MEKERTLILFLGLVLSLGTSFAGTPNVCEDSELKTTLDSRKVTQECLDKIQVKKNAYVKLWENGKIPDLSAADSARREFVDQVGECGHCATRDIVAQEIPADGDHPARHVLISDGSCEFPAVQNLNLEGAEKEMFTALLHDKQYKNRATKDPVNKPKEGGFRYVLDFFGATSQGEQDPNLDQMPLNQDSYSYIAVQGPVGFAFKYFLKNTPTQEQNGDWLRFDAVSLPPGADWPEMKDEARGTDIHATALNRLSGFWCLQPGYVRYHTEADVPFTTSLLPPLAFRDARSILLDTIVQLSEWGGLL